MKNWSLLIKRVLLAGSCVLFSTVLNAATIESYKTNDLEGVNLTSSIFDILLTANTISGDVSNISIDETFDLQSGVNSDGTSYTGTLTIGSLLTASFEDLTYSEIYFPGTSILLSTGFDATLTYTGGSLMGSYTGGVLTGNISADLVNINATVAEVQVVPVPAAVWLFGSGLLGLAGIARRKKLA